MSNLSLRQWSRHPIPPLSPEQLDNLRSGVFIAVVWPQIAFRNCEVCQKVQFDERTGSPLLDARNQLQERFTECLCELERTDDETGCPRHTPASDRGLTAENKELYAMYQQYAARGSIPPHDPHFNLAVQVIQEAEREAKEYVSQRPAEAGFTA